MRKRKIRVGCPGEKYNSNLDGNMVKKLLSGVESKLLHLHSKVHSPNDYSVLDQIVGTLVNTQIIRYESCLSDFRRIL